MKLPPPFQSAKGLKPNLDGSISLIDAQSKTLARIPITTAFALACIGDHGCDGCGDGYGYGLDGGQGYGQGGYGQGYSSGKGYGHESKAP